MRSTPCTAAQVRPLLHAAQSMLLMSTSNHTTPWRGGEKNLAKNRALTDTVHVLIGLAARIQREGGELLEELRLSGSQSRSSVARELRGLAERGDEGLANLVAKLGLGEKQKKSRSRRKPKQDAAAPPASAPAEAPPAETAGSNPDSSSSSQSMDDDPARHPQSAKGL